MSGLEARLSQMSIEQYAAMNKIVTEIKTLVADIDSRMDSLEAKTEIIASVLGVNIE